jgi:NitT/TauT family transport system substrate-binding protein
VIDFVEINTLDLSHASLPGECVKSRADVRLFDTATPDTGARMPQRQNPKSRRHLNWPNALLPIAASLGLLAMLAPGQAAAEGKIRIAQQFGISYLTLDVIRDQKLIEKHGKEAGLDITVEWATVSGATAMNEALLSDNLDIAAAGAYR